MTSLILKIDSKKINSTLRILLENDSNLEEALIGAISENAVKSATKSQIDNKSSVIDFAPADMAHPTDIRPYRQKPTNHTALNWVGRIATFDTSILHCSLFYIGNGSSLDSAISYTYAVNLRRRLYRAEKSLWRRSCTLCLAYWNSAIDPQMATIALCWI